MIDVFLSASVPLPTRNRAFFETANILLIREAVKGLVEVVLPLGRITSGGHPAITPLLALFVRESGLGAERLTIFQSSFFSNTPTPSGLEEFSDIRFVEAVDGDREKSLLAMRVQMIRSRAFSAAVFVGGMEGVLEEASIFQELHPDVPVLPIASTGAAAALLYERGSFDSELADDLTFPSLFRRKLVPLH